MQEDSNKFSGAIKQTEKLRNDLGMENIQINLGEIKTTSKNLVAKISDLSFCMGIGGSSSGKSFWLNNIYKQLEAQMSPEELGYVILNASVAEEALNESYTLTRSLNTVDENGYVLMALLGEYAERARQRANGDESKTQHIVVHIEGGDLALTDTHGNYFALVTLLAQNAKQANMSLMIVNNRANELETPLEITKLCSLIALFSSANYIPNAKYLRAATPMLDKFEKQIILNNKNYIVKPLDK